jgi:hypothetical protein
MKRIIAISTLAVVACFGFSSAANAADVSDISTHSGTVTSVCSVKATAGDFVTDGKAPVNGVDFPTSLKSTGGKFETLCNKSSNNITVENSGTNTLPTGAAAPTVTYALTATSGAYADNAILGTKSITTQATGTVSHGFTNSTSALNVSVKVAAPNDKILEQGSYIVPIKATLTP